MAIKLRRGLESERTTVLFEQGEIVYVTNTKKVYIGDGLTMGGNLVTGEELLSALDDVVLTSLANGNLLIYDSTLQKWENIAPTTDNIPEGSNLYYTDARFDSRLATKTTDDLTEGTNEYYTAARVRAVLLTGISLVTNAVISATDSVLIAFGKIQAQITANLTTLTNHVADTSNPHEVTKTQVGLSNVDNTSDANKPVSTATQTALNLKQDTLVSNTNIKTINGESILGAGNIVTSVELEYRHDFNVFDYLGKAPSDSLESDNVWTITRLTIASDGSVTRGVATNVNWTNRYTHTYL